MTSPNTKLSEKDSSQMTVAERLFKIENGKVLYERLIPLKRAKE